ncbi:NAD(P)/FAD-dependent oxidoreductase [Flavobacterium xinjiangense]|uniref:Phytoene dehydrogenase-related protein n=1 Tax=Flavobacterium xinjiangense TaxID=178356 RepID=A0A1M7IGM6_9FLAO|nr:NAD(P)/FAD-dependent oxidoreductase [Flavobacterium xinjiangense]SHM39860.1 Phytoene dehydrogenase-related protein [Flavobacterium xinjiangense]
MKQDVIIVGAGLAGLSAAVYLHRQGRKVLVLEASERAGGRIKTDSHEGFLLDRGFQVLLTAYPETQALLNYRDLKLQKMLPGATVLYDGGRFEIADPFRRPSAAFATLFAPVGTLKDKLNTLWLKNKLQKLTIKEIFEQPEQTTRKQLADYGFSPKMIQRFYAPFLSGIFLENELSTSRRMFDFVMKMFSDGDVAVPALGMEEIPKQLVAMLPEDSFQYNTKVTAIDGNKVTTADGTVLEANQILLATTANNLTQKFFPKQKMNSHQVTNIYFEANEAPTKKAVVILNASITKKWVNNLTVMSNVSKAYAPKGKVLISVSYNGIPTVDDATLAENMKQELKKWYGEKVTSWKMLKAYRIEYALPSQESVKNEINASEIKISDSLFICGDHLLNGSINAALKTGRLAAETMKL